MRGFFIVYLTLPVKVKHHSPGKDRQPSLLAASSTVFCRDALRMTAKNKAPESLVFPKRRANDPSCLFFHIALEGNRRIALQVIAKLIVLTRQDRVEQDSQDSSDSQTGQGQAAAAKGKG